MAAKIMAFRRVENTKYSLLEVNSLFAALVHKAIIKMASSQTKPEKWRRNELRTNGEFDGVESELPIVVEKSNNH